MNNRLPSQDYGPLFTSEQVAAVRSAQRASDRAEEIKRATEHQPTIITHTDRGGNPWRFFLSCTEAQAENLKRILENLRTIGNRQACTFAGILNADDNAEFYRGLERLFLTALLRRFPQQPAEEIQTNRERTERNATPRPQAETEEPTKYWWQND